ncbi:MAG TPA: hypothetical protein G4N95_01550 [Anaerolineae bacterium]|nr:hypothetical protein [Anaerolineae bacterium]
MKSTQLSRKFDWFFWVQWIFASLLGWIIGSLFFGDLGVGIALGILQWLILRTRLSNAWLWIIMTAIGWGFGSLIILLVLPPHISVVPNIMLGLSIGFFQWLVLRKQVYQAWWWILVNGFAWAFSLLGYWGIIFVGGSVGLLTGITLELMVRYSDIRNTSNFHGD